MSSIIRLVLNLSINVKLGIASGLGVLLVGTMVITQMYANTAKRDLDARMSEQQTIARDAVEVKASVAGMLPMALGLGEGGEQNAPLGRAVIGGLALATVATLFVVPVIYTFLRRGRPVSHELDTRFEAEARGEMFGGH